MVFVISVWVISFMDMVNTQIIIKLLTQQGIQILIHNIFLDIMHIIMSQIIVINIITTLDIQIVIKEKDIVSLIMEIT